MATLYLTDNLFEIPFTYEEFDPFDESMVDALWSAYDKFLCVLEDMFSSYPRISMDLAKLPVVNTKYELDAAVLLLKTTLMFHMTLDPSIVDVSNENDVSLGVLYEKFPFYYYA